MKNWDTVAMLFCQYAFYATQLPPARGRGQENKDKVLEKAEKGSNHV